MIRQPSSVQPVCKQLSLVILIASCLMAQVFMGWHAGKHGVHEASHCQVCVMAAHVDHTAPVEPVMVTAPAMVSFVHYNETAVTETVTAPLKAYAAQGPPAA